MFVNVFCSDGIRQVSAFNELMNSKSREQAEVLEEACAVVRERLESLQIGM